MKKAMMYLLLALGITLGVVFVGGATAGFVAGFIDGFNGDKVGTTSSMTYMVVVGSVFIIILCVVLQWVFLKLGFASYTIGRIPKSPKKVGLKVVVGTIVAMIGLAVFYWMLLDKSISNGESDEFVMESYSWMRQHPIFTILILLFAEATANLVIYGAVLREILEWKHRPFPVVYIFAMIMSLFSLIEGMPSLMTPAFAIALFEAALFEYTRSIIPIIIGDVVFWIVMLCLVGLPSSGWAFLVAVPMMGVGGYFAINSMEPYKPID